MSSVETPTRIRDCVGQDTHMLVVESTQDEYGSISDQLAALAEYLRENDEVSVEGINVVPPADNEPGYLSVTISPHRRISRMPDASYEPVLDAVVEPNVYDRALDIIGEQGWCKGARQAGTGEVCLIGSIEQAIFGHVDRVDDSHRAYDLPEVVALIDFIPGLRRPDSFNDHSQTTQDDVEAVLRSASAAVGA